MQLFLSKGEQRSIKVSRINSISIGNSEVISKKLILSKNKLLIKGKKIGYSDLILGKGKKSLHYHIFVLSKNEGLKIAKIAQTLSSPNINFKIMGKRLLISGKIQSINELKNIYESTNEIKKYVSFNFELSTEIKKQIIANLYEDFHNSYYKDYQCQTKENNINCSYSGYWRNKELEKKYYNSWRVNINFKESQSYSDNFEVSLKLFQVELSQGKQFSLGLQSLKGNIKNLIKRGTITLYENNTINLDTQDHSLKLIAEPIIISRLGKSSKLQIGLDIPFSVNSRNDIVQTNWRETGLKVNFKIYTQKNKLSFKYKTELSSPVLENIKTNNQEGDLFIDANNEYFEFFHTGMSSQEKFKEGILGLKDIPLIGLIFRSKNISKTYQYLIGFLKIKKI